MSFKKAANLSCRSPCMKILRGEILHLDKLSPAEGRRNFSKSALFYRFRTVGRESRDRQLNTLDLCMTKIGELNKTDKDKLIAFLQKDNPNPTAVLNNSDETPITPTYKQLLHVSLYYSLPFIGFGFLDNFIMLVAGDYIDLTIGTTFGLSTMAAAALGNAISDVAGVGSAQFVETTTHKLGFPLPNLNPRELKSRSTTFAINFGRAYGVLIGCLLGMFPLLFLPSAEGKKEKQQ